MNKITFKRHNFVRYFYLLSVSPPLYFVINTAERYLGFFLSDVTRNYNTREAYFCNEYTETVSGTFGKRDI